MSKIRDNTNLVTYEMSSNFILNHPVAKFVLRCMNPDDYNTIESIIDDTLDDLPHSLKLLEISAALIDYFILRKSFFAISRIRRCEPFPLIIV